MATAGRKRKTESQQQQSEPSTSSVKLKRRRLSPASSENSTCESVGSDNAFASSACSSSSGSKFVDLKENAVMTSVVECFATSAGDSVDFRDRRDETTPSSEVEAESGGELESTAEMPRHRLSTAEKMPTDAELEDFFAAAEKNLQKQFIDKYNFDIVKEEPLEGRYEWVPVDQLKP